MKTKDLREFSTEQLRQHADDVARELLGVREAVRVGKEKNAARIGVLRRAVARSESLLRERELAETGRQSV